MVASHDEQTGPDAGNPGQTIAGIVIGLASSVATAKLMGSLLFGVHAWDFSTLVGVASLLWFSALLASLIPARRASSFNPVEALSAE